MNWRTIGTLLAHELRILLRDRRTVMLSVVLPLATTPLMLYSMKFVSDLREARLARTVYRYAVTGSQAESARAAIRAAAANPSPPEPGADRNASRPFRIAEVSGGDLDARLQAKTIHFYLEALSGPEADEAARREEAEHKAKKEDRAAARAPDPDPFGRRERAAGAPLIRIYFDGSRDESQAGRRRMGEMLTRARTLAQAEILDRQGFPLQPWKVAGVAEVSVASPSQVTGLWIGRFLTVFLLMFMLAGGSVVAMDIVAGEKERGSLETLLTTAARRIEIVAAKQLAILAVALVITLIQVANILLYLGLKVVQLPWNAVIDVPPAAVVTVLVLFVPTAALVASVLLMLSAYSKSYKEAQLYFFPVYLCAIVPALASLLPGVPLRSAIALVPIANVSVAVREVMVGDYDWPMLALSFLVMTGAAAWTLVGSAQMLSRERLITASEFDAADLAGGPALFPKHVLRWYAVFGAILFAVAANVAELATFRRQLLFNELGIFLVGPLLMIWRYRLDPREALALRPVRPAVWLAALMLIPAGNLVGVGVFRLADKVVPVPREVVEQFSRSILPEDIPVWQLFVFIAVLPGIFEEIAFRGTLLYGLRQRFRPAALAVVVGLIFGLFHVQLFRLAPTGFMGVILTAVALLTGSIFPGMLVHAGNNAFALWAAREEFPLAGLDLTVYLGALVVFALAFYILYRNRTPYPEIRS